MVNKLYGLHHHRKHQKVKPVKKRFIDRIIYFIVFIGPLMTITQVVEIWINKNASGVSIITWGAYLFTSMFWLNYGLFHKDRPIILSAGMWIFMEILIIFGILLYG